MSLQRTVLPLGVLVLLFGCNNPSPSSTSSSPPASGSVATLSAASASAAPASASASAVPSVSAAAPAVAPTTIAAQHILIAYKGADRAPKSVTRTKGDAKKRASEVLA